MKMIFPSYKALEAPLRDRIIDAEVISSVSRKPGLFNDLKRFILSHPTETAAVTGTVGAGGYIVNQSQNQQTNEEINNTNQAQNSQVNYTGITNNTSPQLNNTSGNIEGGTENNININKWFNEIPNMNTVLAIGIPGALLAGAGALALRRKQKNLN